MAGISTMSTKLEMVKAGEETANLVLAHLQSIGEQSTESEEVDVTTLDSPNRAKEFIQGAKDPGSIDVVANNCFDGQVEKLQAVFDAGTVRSWIETYPDSGGTLSFTAYISSFTFGEATTDGLITANFTLRLTGKPVYAEAS
jgi:predicted secreted protein